MNTIHALNQFLQDFKQMSKSAETLADSWSNDPNYRNRPDRQALTSKLMCALPNPITIGKIHDDILKSISGN